MLQQPLMQKLSQLKLHGIRHALEEQSQSSQYSDLTFEERLGLLIDRECTRRENARLQRNIKAAEFQFPACMEDVKFSAARNIDKKLVLSLAECDWVRNKLNILITGFTGSGKTYMACALGQAACRQGFTVRYLRLSRLFTEFTCPEREMR